MKILDKVLPNLPVFVLVLQSLQLCGQNGESAERFQWPEGKKVALSLSFDDARLSNVDVGLDLFEKFDVKVTYYVIPGAVEKRLAQWKKAVLQGHEIGNHTLYHPCSGNFTWDQEKALESYNLAAMRQELLDANDQINTLLGVTPVSFAYSCGQTYVGRGQETRSYVPLIDELFDSGRGWLDEGTNDPYFVDFAQLQGVEMDGKDFEQDIKPILKSAQEHSHWVVLAGHEIGPDGRQTSRTKMLEELMTYVRDSVSDIWLAPVGEVTSYVRKQRDLLHQYLIGHLSFYSSFDHGFDADYAKGDDAIYTSDNAKSEVGHAGIHIADVRVEEGQGRYGSGLVFNRKTTETLYYLAKNNINYGQSNLSGSVSFWLSLDPENDLEPGYCDPIQITDAGYNDAAYWVDFSDKNPRLFRMGVFGDLEVWNPKDISPDDNPAFNNRLIVAQDRPFGNDFWTHIAIVFENLNEKSPGTATFYVNGKVQGDREITEPFTWDIEKSKIFLGLNYIGRLDELAVFSKPLTAQEIQAIYQLEEGISSLLQADKK